MRIIIAGAGAVGTHLAKMLVRDNFDIVLLDEHEERLRGLDTNYDLMTKIGRPTSLEDLMECDVQNADLFIAVTPDESVNMTACMLATNLGAKKTVARINNTEYLKPKNAEFFKKLGVDSLIMPERLAANEIIDSLKFGWLREQRYFCDKALMLVCVKVRSTAPLVNKLFSSGYFDHGKYRIVAIKRHSRTIIPKGSDEVLAGDIVYFITTKENLEFVRKDAAKTLFAVNKVMFMGGGSITRRTIRDISNDVEIIVVESNKERCRKMAEMGLSNLLIVQGDGRDLDLLKSEGLQEMDAFVAITDNSEANTLTCLTAKSFGIKKTIAEIENLDYIDVADNLDIGTIINKKLIAASYIYQLTLNDDVLNVQCLTYSDAEIVEFIVNENDKITKAKVKDLRLPKDVNIGGVVRNGKGFVVNGETQILPNDHVVIFCTAASIRKLEKLFNP
ncbi:MAG: Trk system potassium transporter TrkA [Paludibacteraceae bacterium]|nr:Trk system potassium transporter TrkA [Paludibacteraceae bacterium]